MDWNIIRGGASGIDGTIGEELCASTGVGDGLVGGITVIIEARGDARIRVAQIEKVVLNMEIGQLIHQSNVGQRSSESIVVDNQRTERPKGSEVSGQISR